MSQSLSSGPYSYCLEQDEIRLFRLKAPPPGQGGASTLEGRVKVFKLQQCPRYRALSYRWGAKDDKTDLQISLTGGPAQQTKKVPRNLYDYLLTIKLNESRESRWMWIDSICINQDEDEDALRERRRQVARMDQIYASASWVTVWLGAHHGGASANPVHWLNFFLSNKKNFPGLVPWDPVHLATIRQNPYWQRLWIIQEICKHK